MTEPIESLDALRERYPPPAERSLDKQLDHLDAHGRDFIERSPFMLLATAGADGACDVSPKGGPPGFVRVLDERRLLIADATGNRRLDSMQNLLANPQAGLLFLIPGMGETLRVNGACQIVADGERAGLLVTVREAYLHCAKALIRSRLWQPDSWPDEVPSAARILADHMELGSEQAAAAMLEESYTKRL